MELAPSRTGVDRFATPTVHGFGPLLRAALVAAGFLLFALGVADTLNFTVDDTFISMRYAENLAAGRGAVYNPGDHVEGYSNPLWTALLGAAARAGWSQRDGDLRLLVAAKAMGVVFGLATLIVLLGAILPYVRERPWRAFAVLGVGSSYSFALWTVSGLETPLVAFLFTAGAVLALAAVGRVERGESPGARHWLAGLALGLATWVRPEPAIVLALALGVAVLVSPRAVRASLLRVAAPIAVLFAILVAWRLQEYGALVPNTVVAKSGGGVMQWLTGIKYALSGLALSVGFAGLVIVAAPGLWRGSSAFRMLACLVVAYVLFVAASGGDWMPGYRFLVPFLPLLWLLVCDALDELTRRQPGMAPAPALAALLVLLATTSFFAGRSLVRAQQTFPTALRGVTWTSFPDRLEVAHALRAQLAAGDTLALFEAGCIPYYLPDHHVIDLSGLSDRAIARLPGRHMEKMTPEAFFARSPEWYLTMIKWGQPSGDARRLLGTDAFRSGYRLERLFDANRRALETALAGGSPPFQEGVAFALFRRRAAAGDPAAGPLATSMAP